MHRVAALAIVALLALPAFAAARQSPAPEGPAGPDTQSAPQESRSARSIDATKLGVSLDRIRRELRQADAAEDAGDGPLKLAFTVEVYGTAPKIDLLRDFPLTGPVPYGAPTHREVLEFLTPQEFRSPVIPFSAVAYWAAQQLWNKSKKARCEEELAEYRRLVMQGVAVAAPRCTQ